MYGGVFFKLFCVYASVGKKGRLDLFEKIKNFLGEGIPLLCWGILTVFYITGIGVGGGGDVDKSGKELQEILHLFGLRDVREGGVFSYFSDRGTVQLIFVFFLKMYSSNPLIFGRSLFRTMVRLSVL